MRGMQLTQSLVHRKDFGFPMLLELGFKVQFMDHNIIISLPVEVGFSLEQKYSPQTKLDRSGSTGNL